MQTEADVEVLNIEISSNWNDSPTQGLKTLVSCLEKLKTLETSLQSGKQMDFAGVSTALRKMASLVKPLSELTSLHDNARALKALPKAISGYNIQEAETFSKCASIITDGLTALRREDTVDTLNDNLARLKDTLGLYKEANKKVPKKDMRNLTDWLLDLQVLEAGLQSTENSNFASISSGLENVSGAVKTFDDVPNIGKIATTLKRIPPILSEYKEEDADVFSKCISSIGTALGTLPSSDKLKPLNGALRSLAKSLGAYKDVNVGKVNDVILNLNTALSYFKVDEASREISKICTQLNKLPARLEQFNSVDLTGLKRVTAEIDKMVTLMTKLNDVPNLKDFIASVKELRKGGGTASGLPSNVNKPEIEEVDIEVAKGISSVERLKEAFYKLKEVIGESCEGALGKIKSLGRATLAVAGKIMSMLTAIPLKIGKMVVQRVLYRIVTYIANSVKEGINNFYQYSKVADGTFSKAMDRIATSSLYVKNSFGALVGALIEKVTPYLEAVFDTISACVNKLNEFYAKLTGAESWTRAKKVPIEYAASVEKLKRAILSFDKLNILNFNKQLKKASKLTKSSKAKYSTMFEEVKVVDNGSVDRMRGKYTALGSALEKCKNAAGEFWNRIWTDETKETILSTSLTISTDLVSTLSSVIELLNNLRVPELFNFTLRESLLILSKMAKGLRIVTTFISNPKAFATTYGSMSWAREHPREWAKFWYMDDATGTIEDLERLASGGITVKLTYEPTPLEERFKSLQDRFHKYGGSKQYNTKKELDYTWALITNVSQFLKGKKYDKVIQTLDKLEERIASPPKHTTPYKEPSTYEAFRIATLTNTETTKLASQSEQKAGDEIIGNKISENIRNTDFSKVIIDNAITVDSCSIQEAGQRRETKLGWDIFTYR